MHEHLYSIGSPNSVHRWTCLPIGAHSSCLTYGHIVNSWVPDYITLPHTTQENGLVERFHQHLKSALRARLTNHKWLDKLLWVLLGIRTTPKEDLNCSSAELVYGSPLTVPGNFIATPQGMHDSSKILSQLRDMVSKFAPIPSIHHGGHRTFVPSDL